MLRLTEQDISNMGPDPTHWFDVTVTETLELIVRVEAHSPKEAERVVSRDWKKQELVLGSEHFRGVEFRAELADESGELP